MWLPAALALLLLAPAAHAEESSTNRRNRHHLQADVLSPLSSGFGGRWLGYGVSAASWKDFGQVVVLPRLGARFGPGSRGSYYLDVGSDVGVCWLPMGGWLTPLVGGGVGLRYVYWSTGGRKTVEGAILEQTVRAADSDWSLSAYGFGRAGAIAFRNEAVHVTVFVDYAMTVLGEMKSRAALVSAGLAF